MPTETQSPLQALIEPLDELEYIAEFKPAGDEAPFDKLYISLNVDEEEEEVEDKELENEDEGRPVREYGLEVFFINDLTKAAGDAEEEKAVIAHLMVVLPFRIRGEAYLEIMRYCALVNRLLPVGVFGLSEQDGAVYLRHCLATKTRAIPEVVLIEVVTALEYACKQYTAQFEAISAGTLTTDEELRQFEEAGHPLPSVGNPELFAAG